MAGKKTYMTQGILLFSIILLNCSSAQAVPVAISDNPLGRFINTWAEMANDSRRHFDAEYLFHNVDVDSDKLSIEIQSSFDINKNKQMYGSHHYDSYGLGFSLDLAAAGINDLCHLNTHWAISGNNDDISRKAAVPEPATMLLLGTGLLGMTSMQQRRKKKQA